MPVIRSRSLAALTAGLLALAGTGVSAAPIHFTIEGTVTDATNMPFVTGDDAFANVYFDLDTANALNPSGEDTSEGGIDSRAWTFSGAALSVSPYNQTTFSFDSGAYVFGSPDFVYVEILNDFDADANGNPLGLSGIVDAMIVNADSDTIPACTSIDPDTGACTDPNQSVESGEYHQLLFVSDASWFADTNDLPSFLAPGAYSDILGTAELIESSNVIGDATIVYQASSAQILAEVPAPATGLLAAPFLLSVLASRRRRTHRA